MTTAPVLMTIGVIAHRLGVSEHRIRYACRSRNIQPTGVAGSIFTYDEATVERIRQALAEIERGRQPLSA